MKRKSLLLGAAVGGLLVFFTTFEQPTGLSILEASFFKESMPGFIISPALRQQEITQESVISFEPLNEKITSEPMIISIAPEQEKSSRRVIVVNLPDQENAQAPFGPSPAPPEEENLVESVPKNQQLSYYPLFIKKRIMIFWHDPRLRFLRKHLSKQTS